ncbi:uncharacterized protein LOC134176285 [Corticium candelabrum]|uniref:uncharacterized protein LOC134176285 n=1 Tax=Corticium candelabrum TaxID=121492 RepID=UPI002E275E0B|nr:uncharacterized protein LOC134176285 [Corticium candelabrum]
MRLLDFADAYELVVTNTLFQHKHIHTANWYPPSGCLQPSVKDFILVKHRMRSMVYDTRVKRGPDFKSDHKLVVSKLVLKLKKPKNMKQANSLRRDVRGDPKALGEYRVSITAKFLQRSSDTVEDNWSEFRKPVVDSAKEHLVAPRRAKNSWISEQNFRAD